MVAVSRKPHVAICQMAQLSRAMDSEFQYRSSRGRRLFTLMALQCRPICSLVTPATLGTRKQTVRWTQTEKATEARQQCDHTVQLWLEVGESLQEDQQRCPSGRPTYIAIILATDCRAKQVVTDLSKWPVQSHWQQDATNDSVGMRPLRCRKYSYDSERTTPALGAKEQ